MSNSTEVTATAGFLTVSLQVALFPPQEAVMFAVPSAFAVTSPVGVTAATVALEEFQVTFFSVALDGDTVAVSCKVFPITSSASVFERVTEETATTDGVIGPSGLSSFPPPQEQTTAAKAINVNALNVFIFIDYKQKNNDI